MQMNNLKNENLEKAEFLIPEVISKHINSCWNLFLHKK